MPSPEVSIAHPPSYEQLLALYDTDPLGYIAHALTAVQTVPSSAGLVPLAEFASDMGDTQLMASCFPGIHSVEKWRLFAYDGQHGASTIPTDLLRNMGEKLGQIEERAAFTDKPTIACIYAAQLGLIPPTESHTLESHLRKLELCIGDAGRRDRLNVVQTLCLAGLLNDAKRFSVYLHDDDKAVYLALTRLQQLRMRGKPFPICKTEAERTALRELDPNAYAVQLRTAIQHDEDIHWHPSDVKALLEANETAEARMLYEQLVQASYTSNLQRARMALWMARKDAVTYNYDTVEAMSYMSGCRKFVAAVENPESTPEARAASLSEVTRRIMETGQLLARMPFSSRRIALQLELNDIQQTLVPDNTDVRDFCQKTAIHSWNVAVATLTDANAQRLTDHSEVIRELQKDYKEVGLDMFLQCTPKGRTMEPRPSIIDILSRVV